MSMLTMETIDELLALLSGSKDYMMLSGGQRIALLAALHELRAREWIPSATPPQVSDDDDLWPTLRSAKVLVADARGSLTTAYFEVRRDADGEEYGRGWVSACSEGWLLDDVTHWMALPEGPGESGPVAAPPSVPPFDESLAPPGFRAVLDDDAYGCRSCALDPFRAAELGLDLGEAACCSSPCRPRERPDQRHCHFERVEGNGLEAFLAADKAPSPMIDWAGSAADLEDALLERVVSDAS
jgi:hypothetical protein